MRAGEGISSAFTGRNDNSRQETVGDVAEVAVLTEGWEGVGRTTATQVARGGGLAPEGQALLFVLTAGAAMTARLGAVRTGRRCVWVGVPVVGWVKRTGRTKDKA
jgi:hypothetical protein